MNPRFLGISFGILLAAAPLATAQQRKNAPSAKMPIVKSTPNKGLTKAEKQQRLVERFNNMNPEQQQRVLANMPPERRRQVQQNLEQYRRLSKEQKKQIANQLDQLPVEKRQAALGVYRRINQLPDERKVPVRNEIRRLNGMPEDKRAARLESKDFKKLYSPEEQQMISEVSGIFSAN
ncbi:MAG: DUF3106 domain-containing protein [Acidobacteria bacterium]|nr:DUF3106 domain-containing protein [Acidobacteriota bacterium]